MHFAVHFKPISMFLTDDRLPFQATLQLQLVYYPTDSSQFLLGLLREGVHFASAKKWLPGQMPRNPLTAWQQNL